MIFLGWGEGLEAGRARAWACPPTRPRPKLAAAAHRSAAGFCPGFDTPGPVETGPGDLVGAEGSPPRCVPGAYSCPLRHGMAKPQPPARRFGAGASCCVNFTAFLSDCEGNLWDWF